MRLLFTLLFARCIISGFAQNATFPPLDSVRISFPVKVHYAQLTWKLVTDDNVRTAIATAIDTMTDTAATVTVVLTGTQVAIVHGFVTRHPVGVVRPLSEVLERTLLPFLSLPQNMALAIAFAATEEGSQSTREAMRLAGARGCQEQAATIRRNR